MIMDTTTTLDAIPDPEPAERAPADAAAPNGRGPDGRAVGCTQAQLRRFIKSRPYVPMHELRRRFELNGHPDDVNPITSPDGTIWIGLPPRESGFLGELLRQGDIGVELCHDPTVRIVVGVYPMRPVSR
jgi:hypothetical protein